MNHQSIGQQRFLDRSYIEPLMAALAARPSELGPHLEAEPAILSFIADEVGPRLAAVGMVEQHIDEMGNLVARIGRGEPGFGRLLLVINAMTQPAFDMPHAFVPRVVRGRQFGIPGDVMIARGVSEQKANMAASLAAVGAALAGGPPIRGELIVLCCPSGETGRHDAIAHAIESGGIEADMAILGGTSLQISLGNRGRVDLELEVRGLTAHSSRPEQGANAALEACGVVERLIRLGNEGNEHPDLGPATLTLTALHSSPETTHTIQDRCKATFDRRLLPGEDPHAVTASLQALLENGGPYVDRFSNRELTASLEMGPYMYPSLVEADAPIVEALQKACLAAIGRPVERVYLPNAFDQGYLNHVGIPAVNFGCGEYAFAHTDHDLASIERTVMTARVLAQLIGDVTAERR